MSNFRVKVGEGVAGISDEIGELVQKAQDGEEKLDTIISKFERLIDDKQ